MLAQHIVFKVPPLCMPQLDIFKAFCTKLSCCTRHCGIPTHVVPAQGHGTQNVDRNSRTVAFSALCPLLLSIIASMAASAAARSIADVLNAPVRRSAVGSTAPPEAANPALKVDEIVKKNPKNRKNVCYLSL